LLLLIPCRDFHASGVEQAGERAHLMAAIRKALEEIIL
jgi:hypothetical protein